MVQFNLTQREITLKVVFYGPALSGKTTNLQVIHRMLDPQCRGRLMTLDTADDRTLFFDLMPIFFRTSQGFKVKLKLYTVPGQVMHNSTRRIVLSGADAVVFVADSQLKEARANQDAWAGMIENLKQNGIDPAEIPIVIQFNKRDLPGIRTDEDIERMRQVGREPVYAAVAVEGRGVMETFQATMLAAFRHFNTRYDFERKFGLTEQEFLSAIFKNVGPGGLEGETDHDNR